MLQICRTCLHKIQDSNFFTLTNNSTVAIIIKNQLALCIPEIIPDTVSDPVMCHSCVTALHSAFDFKYRCLQSEERIRNFVQSNRIHNSPVGINLMEMFSNICGDESANAFADNVRIVQNTQFINNFETLDIKYEALPVDEVEDLVKIDAYTLADNVMEDICEENVDCRLSNQDHNIMSPPITKEMCNLEKLCDSEELQLHFNCMFVEDEFSMIPVISNDNQCYNLEDWNRFEERHLRLNYSRETSDMENDEEENLHYHNVPLSYNTDQMHSRDNEKIAAINEQNVESNVLLPSVRRPRLIRAAKCKIEMQSNPYNPINILKRKKVSYNKLRFVKPAKRSKCNAVKNLLKCSECEYTTKLKINLELHSVSHININNDCECEMNLNSHVQECATTYDGRKSLKCSKGYEYLRYDYPKKKTFKSGKRNYIKRKKYFQKDGCKDKHVKNDHNYTKTRFGKDKCIRNDDNINNEFVESVEFITNYENEDISFTSDCIEKNKSIGSESRESQVVTNDHIEDNKKDRAGEKECLTTNSVEKDKVIKGFHNIVEQNNLIVEEDIFKIDNHKKKDLLKNNCNKKEQSFKTGGTDTNRCFKNNNFLKNQFSKNNIFQVDNPKSNDHVEWNQYEKSNNRKDDYNPKNYIGESQPSKTNHVIEHQFLERGQIEENSGIRGDHSDSDNLFENGDVEESTSLEDHIDADKSFKNGELEQKKSLEDHVNTDKSFKNGDVEGNKSLEDLINVDKIFGNGDVEKNKSLEDHIDTDESLKDGELEQNKSVENHVNADKSFENGDVEGNTSLEDHVDADKFFGNSDVRENKSFEDHIEDGELEQNKFLEDHVDADKSFKNGELEQKKSLEDHIDSDGSFENGELEKKKSLEDHVNADKSFKNGDVEGNKSLEDYIDTDESFEDGELEQNKYLEHHVDADKSFKNGDVEGNKSLEDHVDADKFFGNSDVGENKSLEDHIDTGESYEDDEFEENKSLEDHVDADKFFKKGDVEAYKSLEDSLTEEDVTIYTEHNQPLKDDHVVNVESKFNNLTEKNHIGVYPSVQSHDTVKQEYENDRINGDRFVCNDHIEENQCFINSHFVEVDIKTNKGNMFNTNKQSLASDSTEKIQPFKNNNRKNKFNSIYEGNFKSEENHIFKNDSTEKDQSFKSNEEYDFLTDNTFKKHVEGQDDYIINDKNDQLLKNDNDNRSGNHSNENAYTEGSFNNTSKENNKFCKSDHIVDKNEHTKDGKSASENQFFNLNDYSSVGDNIKQNQPFKSDNVDGKKFFKRFKYTEKQPFKNTEKNSVQNDYGKHFFTGTHIGDFFKNTHSRKKKNLISNCNGKETNQSGHCAEKLDVPTKRKLRNDHIKKKFFKSECSSKKISGSGCMDNTISRCSDSDHFEFCDCSKHEFAATLKRDVQDKIILLVRKKYPTKEKADAKLLPKVP